MTFWSSSFLTAAIIGTNSPALPLTSERVSLLPSAQQTAWKKYLKRLDRQLQADQTFFFHEMKKHAVKQTLSPPEGRSGAAALACVNRLIGTVKLKR